MSEQMAQDANYNPYAGVQPATPATAPVAAPARPKTVETAFWLLIAAAALVLIRIPVGIAAVNSEKHKEEVGSIFGTANIPWWTSEEISGYVSGGIFTAVILTAIALLSRMGFGWPRIVLILVVISTALNTRVQFFASVVTVYPAAWVTLVSVLLSLAATVLLFLTPSNHYFKSMGQYRKGKKPVKA
ncbi:MULTISPECIES: hypothetical protein [unclassified Arthrobacter]|uniref:hypothetical protein n=1 Tax=unclassified Arthrobacter TaxID=235627 RepID=UPI001D15879B|nr:MULTISPECIES: hypothetical protein [unclassified Arthrobacter]MCC3292177.1 hypothetical protein [Arthrobacter sp. zg-Y1110]MCC3302735.1 hypothetical protein [Arthrobacter sp. zg-Y895]UWX85264.1 hypothetical protein N2K99_01455 [Arthrobacter sp. zg-Y1110]